MLAELAKFGKSRFLSEVTWILESFIEAEHLHFLPVLKFLFQVLIFLEEPLKFERSGLPLGLAGGDPACRGAEAHGGGRVAH